MYECPFQTSQLLEADIIQCIYLCHTQFVRFCNLFLSVLILFLIWNAIELYIYILTNGAYFNLTAFLLCILTVWYWYEFLLKCLSTRSHVSQPHNEYVWYLSQWTATVLCKAYHLIYNLGHYGYIPSVVTDASYIASCGDAWSCQLMM